MGVSGFLAPKAEPLPTSGRQAPSIPDSWCQWAPSPEEAFQGPLVNMGTGARMWAMPGPTQLACSTAPILPCFEVKQDLGSRSRQMGVA